MGSHQSAIMVWEQEPAVPQSAAVPKVLDGGAELYAKEYNIPKKNILSSREPATLTKKIKHLPIVQFVVAGYMPS